MIDDLSVDHLAHIPVPAAVARLHVKDGNLQPLGGDGRKGGVGIAQNEYGVGLLARHHPVALGDDVAHGFAQVRAYGIQIEIGVSQAQLAEEYLVERGVVVLAGMHHHMVEVAVGAAHHGGQADDLRPRAQHGHELELAGHFASSFGASTGRRMVSGRAGSKHSLAHIRVIMSVSPVFSMLWVYPGGMSTTCGTSPDTR